MKTNEARTAIIQFNNWLRAADKMLEVVDHAAHFEQLAKESESRYKALESKTLQLQDTIAKLHGEVDDLREQKQSFKLSLEHETNRLKERHRVERDRLELEVKQATEESNKRIASLQEAAEKAENECKVRERRAKEAAAKAEADLQKLRKRIGAA